MRAITNADAIDEVWHIINTAFYEWQQERWESGENTEQQFHEGFLEIYDYLRGVYGRDITDEDGIIFKPDYKFKLSHYAIPIQ